MLLFFRVAHTELALVEVRGVHLFVLRGFHLGFRVRESLLRVVGAQEEEGLRLVCVFRVFGLFLRMGKLQLGLGVPFLLLSHLLGLFFPRVFL